MPKSLSQGVVLLSYKGICALALATGAWAQTSISVGLGSSAPFLDSGGTNWLVDQGCSTSNTFSTTTTIVGSGIDQPVYQNMRFSTSAFSCTYTVTPNTFYSVTLKFANINNLALNQFIFNVYINQALVRSNLDIAALTSAQPGLPGLFRAADLGFVVPVASTGQVSINLVPVTGGATLNAISINSVSPLGPLPVIQLTRTLPVTVGNEVDIGSFTFTTGTSALWVSVMTQASGNSVSKQYALPVIFNGTAGAWFIANPVAAASNVLATQDFALDININNGVCSLRLRNVLGASGPQANITIRQEGITSDPFTPSTATSAVTPPTQPYGTLYVGNMAGGPTGGNVGVGTIIPTAQLHVVGAGQTSTAFNTAGALGSTLALQDIGINAGNGGAVMFGAGQGFFAAWKGDILNGNNNTTGDLSLGLRHAPTDATLTEVMHVVGITSSVGIGNASPQAPLEVSNSIRTTPVALATLPTCSATNQGSWATINNGSGTITWGSAPATGGTTIVGVFCNGSAWTAAAH